MPYLRGFRITRTGIVFIVGVIVLTGLVLGGLWLVQERGEQARRQEAAKIAEQNLESQSESGAQTPTTTGDNTNAGTVATPSDTETETQTSTVASAHSGDLPQTGADISQVLILALVTLATAYYVTSRRAVARL